MAPAKMAAGNKANYRTYEAQARMVRAIVAAHPDVKWNYKEIAACYGSDMTMDALNHRFRRYRAQALIVKEAREAGLDMKLMMPPDDLPTTKEAVDKNNIAKYFGQSTPDGIQFQFRAIKADAEKLRAVESNGGNVANCLHSTTSSATSTPAKAKSARAATSSSAGRKRAGRGGGSTLKRSSSDDDEDDNNIDLDDDDEDGGGVRDADAEVNWSERDEGPFVKRARPGPKRAKVATPRKAAQRAGATIARAAAVEDFDEERRSGGGGNNSIRRPLPSSSTTSSIFGAVDPARLTLSSGRDPYVGHVPDSDSLWASALGMDGSYADGEI